MKCYDWKKANFSGEPSEVEIHKFYEEIKQSSKLKILVSMQHSRFCAFVVVVVVDDACFYNAAAVNILYFV